MINVCIVLERSLREGEKAFKHELMSYSISNKDVRENQR